jgi:ABC-type Zn2+ transport system substrate-binding protein/surface adhesin
MEIERAALLDASLMQETVAPLTTPSAGELESLREELERLAAAVLELEPPASPEPVAAVELPWALEEGDTAPTVLSFEANRAA